MKLIINSEEAPEIRMWGLKIGDLAIIVDLEYPMYKDEIVLGVYGSVVSLSNPNHTWQNNSNLKIQKLFPGASVTLVQE